MKQSKIQSYINNFRRRLTPRLLPGVGLKCFVYPSAAGGAVLVFQLGQNVENDDQYQPESPSLGRALSGIEQHAFGGNLDGFQFKGTNVILEPDRIILVKEEGTSEWSDSAAKRDVERILSPARGGAA